MWSEGKDIVLFYYKLHCIFSRYEVREPKDGKWGVEGEGGIWTGIVMHLQREEADICLDLTVTPQRYHVIQYTGAYVYQAIVILTSKPRPVPDYLSLIRPFEC